MFPSCLLNSLSACVSLFACSPVYSPAVFISTCMPPNLFPYLLQVRLSCLGCLSLLLFYLARTGSTCFPCGACLIRSWALFPGVVFGPGLAQISPSGPHSALAPLRAQSLHCGLNKRGRSTRIFTTGAIIIHGGRTHILCV